MITNQEINCIFGISESYQLPDKLMTILSDEKQRIELFGKFSDIDLTHDIFTQYFQENHSNRESMMQDFTPPEVCDVISNLLGDFSSCLDVCSGTGGLTISAWKKNPNAEYYVEELSGRAFPILLFNLAIRNIEGYAINKDVLSGECLKVFRLKKGERYSEIEEMSQEPNFPKFDVVVMNPPYSLKHTWDISQFDKRFEGYGYPPTKASDFAFVLDGLYNMSEKGKLVGVLPHGVLFRGNSEEKIRTNLVKNGLMHEIIGLPEKLFLNTQIPVCIMVLKRGSNNTLIIDASREFEKNAKLNRLRAEDIEKIDRTSKNRCKVDKYAEVVSYREIEKNGFNLNIPRYVDTYEDPAPVNIDCVLDNIDELNKKISETEGRILEMLKQLNGNSEDMEVVKKHIKVIENQSSKKKVGKANKYAQTTIFDFIS